MQHPVDVDRLHGCALQRGQQHPAQRIPERHSKAPLEGLGNNRRLTLGIGARRYLQLVWSDQLLPVLLNGHVGTHRVARRGGGPHTPLRPVGIVGGDGLFGSQPDEKDRLSYSAPLAWTAAVMGDRRERREWK